MEKAAAEQMAPSHGKGRMSFHGSISAILTSHNQEAYIGEAIDSVLAQTRGPVEIIVSDNASRDGTRSVLARYADRVVLVMNERDLTRPVSANRAVEKAKGDYIAFLDGDDVWMPRHLEVLAGLLDDHPEAGMAFCRVEMFGAQSCVWPGSLPAGDPPRDFLLELLRHNLLMPSACLIRRDLFVSLGGLDPIRVFYKGNLLLVDDYDLFLKIAFRTDVAAVPDVLTKYRIHSGQNSRNRVPMLNAAILQALRLINEHAKEKRLSPILDQAMDRVYMQWEENLNEVWSQRDFRGLRQMLVFGLRRKALSWKTMRYLFGARLGAVLLRWKGRPMGGGSSRIG